MADFDEELETVESKSIDEDILEDWLQKGKELFANGNLDEAETWISRAAHVGYDKAIFLLVDLKEKRRIVSAQKCFEDSKIRDGVIEKYFGDGGYVVIPDGITGIGDLAFYNCDGLTSIDIPDGVTSIGYEAFCGCCNLACVSLPDSLTSIDNYAFSNCISIKSIEIPSGVKSIESDAFRGCSGLESITVDDGNAKYHNAGNCLIETETKTLLLGCKNSVIPDDGSVENIGCDAFDGCSGLTSINIPSCISSVEESAFRWCSSLASVTVDGANMKYHSAGNCLIETDTKTLVVAGQNCVVPDDGSVERIMYDAFPACDNMQLNEYDNAYYLGNKSNPYAILIKSKSKEIASCSVNEHTEIISYSAFGECGELSNVDIPNSVTNIGSYAFECCCELLSVTIGGSVKMIDECAFAKCSRLTSVMIPSSVTYINQSIFSGCGSLKNLAVDRGNTKYHSAGNCIIETAAKALVAGCQNSVIPNDGSVTSIADHAFSHCSGLSSLVIPQNVTRIGEGAFEDCDELSSINIPDGITDIESSVFSHCGLTSIVIPNSVTSIGDCAFTSCGNLCNAVLPNGLIRIGNRSFAFCYGLSSITFKGTKAQWNAIEKDPEWACDSEIETVDCLDGEIYIDFN